MFMRKIHKSCDTTGNQAIDRLLDICSCATAPSSCLPGKTNSHASDMCIAIACDEAFNFIYPENLRVLEQKGKLTFFSPLYDSELPVSDLVYLPGGYPEFYLSRLSENRTMRQSILNYCQNGGHLFAECGGMMYLGEYITDTDGHSYPMCGFLPQGATMENMKLKLGYRKIFLNGQEYRGHEFHYSRIIPGQSPLPSIARVTNAKGMEVDTPVYRSGHVTASYIHFYWGDLPPFFI